MELDRAKGTRDFGPAEKILRDKAIANIVKTFELYGFVPIETPTIERLDIMSAKFGAGDTSDAMAETYKLTDQGGRELGLRYEFTFALARFLGMNRQLKLPLKRYQIGSIFRDGPIKPGRYREFWQCDVDIVGTNEIAADAEIMSLVATIFKNLNIDVNIEINSRKLLSDIMQYANISQVKETVISLDKLKKIGPEGVTEELKNKGLSSEQIKTVLELTAIEGNNEQRLSILKEKLGATQGILELEELFKLLELFGTQYVFLPSLARGLGYYTGPIFEVYAQDTSVISCSLAGGGRWDDLIGQCIEDAQADYPATGVGIGLEPIMEIIKSRDGLPVASTADLYLIPIKSRNECISVCQKLRRDGVNVAMDLCNKSVGKNMEYANTQGYRFVGIVGPDELSKNMVKIRNMTTGNEELVNADEIKDRISVGEQK